MEHHVQAEVGCTDIVTVDNRCPSRGEAELPEEIRYPMELDSHGSNKSIFGFSRRPRNCTLFLRTLRDGIMIEIDNEGAGRGKIILVTSPVIILVGM